MAKTLKFTTVILITGASTGIGLETAVMLAEQGHKVYATMRNLDKRSFLDSEVEKRKVQLSILQMDVQDEVSIGNCITRILGSEKTIDVLINNAGAGFIRPMEQATMEEIQQVMDVNFYGPIRCSKAVQKPAQIAAVILQCINDPEPKLRYLTSEGAAAFTKLKTSLDPDGEQIKAQVRKGILNK